MYVYKNCVPVKEILILLVCLFRARSFHLGEGVDRDCNVKLVQKQAVIVAKMLHDQRSFFLQPANMDQVRPGHCHQGKLVDFLGPIERM